MVKVREANKQDIVGLATLFEELTGTKSNLHTMTKTFEHMQNDGSYTVLVAEQNGEVVGTAMGMLCYDLIKECKPFMIVKNIVVSKKARDQEIGGKLMTEIKNVGKSHEATCIKTL